MRIIRRIFYAVAVLIIVCCGAVLVCALSPSLTKSLAGVLYGTEEEKEDTNAATGMTGNGTGSANTAAGVTGDGTGSANTAAGVTGDGTGSANTAAGGVDTAADAEAEQDKLQYINPNPQEPLRFEDYFVGTAEEREEWENLKKAGITKEEVLHNLEEYYEDCGKQMVLVGSGQKYFSNVIPEDLWSTIEQEYGEDKHKKGYVDAALKELKKENFEIQIQLDDIGGGYYRIYHNISTW